MIIEELTLTPLKNYPGYYWDVEKQVLYSIKIGGVLRKLKRHKPNPFVRRINGPYYELSRNGHRHCLALRYLETLKVDNENTIKFTRAKEK